VCVPRQGEKERERESFISYHIPLHSIILSLAWSSGLGVCCLLCISWSLSLSLMSLFASHSLSEPLQLLVREVFRRPAFCHSCSLCSVSHVRRTTRRHATYSPVHAPLSSFWYTDTRESLLSCLAFSRMQTSKQSAVRVCQSPRLVHSLRGKGNQVCSHFSLLLICLIPLRTIPPPRHSPTHC
jgi:hypothetical protein